MAVQWSPASAEAYTCPPVVPKYTPHGSSASTAIASRKHVDVAVALGQTGCERLPVVAARAAAIDAQLAVGRIVLRVALDRHDVDGFRLVRVDVDHEAEVGRQVAADLMPQLAGVVGAQDVPVLLHEQHVRT